MNIRRSKITEENINKTLEEYNRRYESKRKAHINNIESIISKGKKELEECITHQEEEMNIFVDKCTETVKSTERRMYSMETLCKMNIGICGNCSEPTISINKCSRCSRDICVECAHTRDISTRTPTSHCISCYIYFCNTCLPQVSSSVCGGCKGLLCAICTNIYSSSICSQCKQPRCRVCLQLGSCAIQGCSNRICGGCSPTYFNSCSLCSTPGCYECVSICTGCEGRMCRNSTCAHLCSLCLLNKCKSCSISTPCEVCGMYTCRVCALGTYYCLYCKGEIACLGCSYCICKYGRVLAHLRRFRFKEGEVVGFAVDRFHPHTLIHYPVPNPMEYCFQFHAGIFGTVAFDTRVKAAFTMTRIKSTSFPEGMSFRIQYSDDGDQGSWTEVAVLCCTVVRGDTGRRLPGICSSRRGSGGMLLLKHIPHNSCLYYTMVL